MSVDGWQTVLVLGGIRSGKSEFAESLVGNATNVRYIATAFGSDTDDPDWTTRIDAHRLRRPASWITEETGADPSRLAEILVGARSDETLLVDDLGGWVTVLLDPAHQPADDGATIGELAAAIRDCTARLVLVSPEVGLSMVPVTPLGRAFADALGSTNQAVAEACDAVVLVVAGQPSWLKPEAALRTATVPAQATPAHAQPAHAQPAQPEPTRPALPQPAPTTPEPAGHTAAGGRPGGAVPAGEPAPPATPDVLTPEVSAPPAEPTPPRAAWAAPTMTLPMVATGLVIQPGMELPMPDEYAGPQALDRLATLDVSGGGLGNLAQVVSFAAATQGTAVPQPWRTIRVLLLHGDHDGGAAAGAVPGESIRRADQARSGDGPLARLAAEAGASLQVVDAPLAAAIEDGPALSDSAVESALRYGWRLAEEAVDSGVQVIVLAACGAGTEAAAAAILTATAGAEPAAVLGRVITPGGQVDDAAWMIRCATVRDALHRIRHRSRGAKNLLAELAGGDITVATGILLGATARRTPVLLDGPVGVAAALLSRDLAGQARHWCLLPDHGGHPAVRLGADVLGLAPLLDLRLDLGEGTTALATLPLLRSTLTLASSLPAHPTLNGGSDSPRVDQRDAEPAGDDEEFVEPEPAGPGPASPQEPPTTEPEPAIPESSEPTDRDRPADAGPGAAAGDPPTGGSATDAATAPRGV
jgi:adenosyl cobinamide kinase/adenosyl cobinamide phosphate guanylyltransferase/NaMN:DMB phosphoribosyltransferase